MKLAQRENLPVVKHVTLQGEFAKEVTDFSGPVKPKDDASKADIEVIKYLAHNNHLFAKEKYIHSYPHCWRCKTPLLKYATSSWFIKTTAVRDRMIEINNTINFFVLSNCFCCYRWCYSNCICGNVFCFCFRQSCFWLF